MGSVQYAIAVRSLQILTRFKLHYGALIRIYVSREVRVFGELQSGTCTRSRQVSIIIVVVLDFIDAVPLLEVGLDAHPSSC